MVPGSISFFVPGRAIAAGSKRAFTRRGAGGHVIGVGVEDSSGKSGREWRAAIRLAAGEAMAEGDFPAKPLEGPLALRLEFYTPRPAGQWGKRGLRPSAPAFPTTRPDVLKLARAVEDACTGILWRDDSQIVDESLRKWFNDTHGVGVVVTVAPILDVRDLARPARPASPQLVLADLVDASDGGPAR